MKQFLKVFSIAFLCFTLAMGAGLFTYFKFYSVEADKNLEDEIDGEDVLGNEDDKDDQPNTPLGKAIQKSKRINVVLLGMEGTRTDTIMFVSLDPDTKKVDIISVPRDTYYYRKGYEAYDLRKINAVYGSQKTEGIMSAIGNVLEGIPIDHYVMVDYKGVEKIVDSIGGVEVNVPFNMYYSDPTDKPPLLIDIKKGTQVLNGKKAIQFLRFRHNNDLTVGYPDGDLGRVKAQQQFIKSAIKKSISFKLPSVINATFKYVKSDVGMAEALLYTKDVYGITTDDISVITLPGTGQTKTINGTRSSYFIHDAEKTKELIYKLYGVEEEKEN